MSKEDIERVERFFRKFENVALLYCSFLKHDKKETDEKAVVLDAAFPVYWYFNSCPYFRNKQRGFFADVGIFHLKRLRNVSWKWSDDRFENNKNYYSFFSGVGIDPYPTFMFLPFPVASKFKKQTLVQQVSQWVYRHSFYPYQKLQGEQLYYFMSRDLSSLPLADSYLYAPQSPSGHMTYSEAHRRSRILSRLDVIEKNLFHM